MIPCGNCKLLLTRHIKALGFSVFKNSIAVAYVFPLFAVCFNIAVTLKHYKGGFLIICIIFQKIAAVKLYHTEFKHF